MQVNVSDYESKYQGELKPGETLDTLYERFNIHRPENFTGHSLSVSDVIVLESGGDKRAFYVDSFGFCEVEDFFAEKLKRSEITFTVAECGEFHSLGRYRDDISNAEEAMVVSAGILISFKFGTFLKASSPMVFNDCGSCTFSGRTLPGFL